MTMHMLLNSKIDIAVSGMTERRADHKRRLEELLLDDRSVVCCWGLHNLEGG